MARPRNLIPSYRKHKQSGRAAVSIYRPDGSRTELILPGKYGSKESKQEYERLLAHLRANDGKLPADGTTPDLTVAELVHRFMVHAQTYYVDPDTGKPTSEIAAIAAAMRPLVRLHAATPAAEFGPLALQTLQAQSSMARGSTMPSVPGAKANRPIGLARSTCNKNMSRIKLLFKWAASVELIPASVHQALATVAGLRRGRSAARETKPVKPIAPAVIDNTLPHLPPVVRDMVEVLLLTGMRAASSASCAPRDLEMSSEFGSIAPNGTKDCGADKERVIAVGPRAQAIIKKYLGTKIDAYLFSPAAQEEMIQANRRANRKNTPLAVPHGEECQEEETERQAASRQSLQGSPPGNDLFSSETPTNGSTDAK